MKACGIVTEYNPFHNGHIHHIEESRRITGCDVLIAVMSGNFTQRGEPAIIDKYERTKAALEHGVDLVLELPFLYVNQSATQFASAGVKILDLAKCTDMVFGSETNNLEELREIAEMPIGIDNLKENMKTGISFPKAYGLMAREYLPNDILAISYLKALQDTDITPHTIQRTTEYHGENMEGSIASAKAIRKAFLNHEDYTETTPMQLDESHVVQMKDYYPMLRTLLLTLDLSYLSSLFLVDEGIENHLKKQAELYDNYEDFLNAAVTRRYTKARIQRTLVSILTQMERVKIKKIPPIDFIQVLGFNETGREYLKELKKQEVKVASRFNQIPKPYRELQYRSDVLYSMFFPDQNEFLKRAIQMPVMQDK